MTAKVLSVGPDTPLRDAARLMDDAGVHRVLVTDRGALMGIPDARDIVRTVARGELIASPDRLAEGLPKFLPGSSARPHRSRSGPTPTRV
jgi:CBS domain-containing protein